MRTHAKNDLKLSVIDSANTKLKAIDFGNKSINVWVNDSVNIAISSTDNKTLYKLKSNNTQIKSQLGDYLCLDVKVNGEQTKVSRIKLISLMLTKSSNPIKPLELAKDESTGEKLADFNPNETQIVINDSVKFISNSGTNVKVDLLNGTAYTVSNNRKLNGNTVYVKYVKNGSVVAESITVNRLVCMLWGIDMPPRSVITLKDESTGYVRENINVVSLSDYMSKVNPKGKRFGNVKDIKLKPIFEAERISAYITEDQMTFDSDDAALDHQIKVDHAKELASIVLDNAECGYALAEQVFLKSLGIERKDVKYKNFIDVFNNNDGVQTVSKEEIAVDVKIDKVFVKASNRKNADILISEIKSRIAQLQAL